MDLDAGDDILQRLADGQSMDYEQWPRLLPRIILHLEKIVHDDFYIPPVPAPLRSSQTVPSFTSQTTAGETSSQASTTSNQSTNKENDPPPHSSLPPGTVPSQIQMLLMSITSTLTNLFQTHPPHTIQRLAELILYPKQHYRNLPAYLHAVDRVVHVTSGAHIFPLPPAIPEPSSAAILSNGASALGVDPLSISWGNPATAPAAAGLGSDESLGGALLTPITWLSTKNGVRSPLEGEVKTESTEMIDGPNGLGGVETVTVSVNGISSTRGEPSTLESAAAASLRAEGGVTQGELLRQEQRAGVVPAAQLDGSRGDTDGMGEEDELPHARGPEEIGMEDMGPQAASSISERMGPGIAMQGIDVEAAVGRRLSGMDGADDNEVKDEKPVTEEAVEPATPKREAEEEIGGQEKRLKEEAKYEDMELVNADGEGDDERKDGGEGVGEDKGADAIETSST